MWLRVLLVVGLVLSVSELALAKAKLASYREYPHGAKRFVVEQFGAEPDVFQEELLEAWVNPAAPRISLQAAAGVGKSAGMAWCAWHFLSCCCLDPYSPPKGLVTGITDQNVKDNFWSEMASWMARSEYLRSGFTHTDKRIFANENQSAWFLGRRAWPKSGSADEQGATLSGLHARSVACFIDESGSIPPTVLRAAEQALSDRPLWGKIVQSGNPIALDGMLYFAANQARSQWVIIRVTNDPDDPKRAKRGDIEWARDQIRLYGRDNPWVMAYILGLFPPSSINTLLGIEDVRRAQERVLRPDEYIHQQKRLGVDVARFGDDRTVIFPRQGRRVFKPIVLRGADTSQVAARIYSAHTAWEAELSIVDSGAMGAGVIDQLRTSQLAQGVLPVAFGGKALAPAKYANKRSEMWWEMALGIKRDWQVPVNCDGDLVGELTEPTYTFHKGVLLLEEKDQIKKRLGRSPDLGDALAASCALPDMPAAIVRQARELRGGASAATEFDPYRSVQS
jgi:phage terminase large subunit